LIAAAQSFAPPGARLNNHKFWAKLTFVTKNRLLGKGCPSPRQMEKTTYSRI
jgi:hypothetical protein